MFKNYFKIAFRNLWKNKTYNFLNITGLALGIASAALIFLWMENEATYNHNVEKHNYLYKVYENQTHDNVSTFLATSGPIAAGLKAEIPGIKNTARLSFNQQLKIVFGLGDKTFNEQGYYADSSIFSMLTLPFVHGNTANAFAQLHSLVISESMALKFFGAYNPVGKTLKVNNEQDYIVTGVFKDLPQNSTFQFQWLAPFQIFESTRSWLSGWSNNGVTTLAELEPSANVASINQKLRGFLNTKEPGNDAECFLYPMNRWNLYNHFTNGKEDNEGEIKYINLFSLIAIIILIIACINFMNLATARSEQRAKEVGVHKVMGANRIKLINRFIAESIVMSFLAVLFSIGII
jgi:putative ABC transport system permease protein